MSEPINHYDPTVITFLGLLWGDGFLSPGGPDEVAKVVDGLDMTGKTVLDIGCGAGGATAALAGKHGAAKVIGIDVEPDPCSASRAFAERAGVADRVEIKQVAAGPLPFEDASFDVVFSKDSIIHIPDKEALAHDIFRILKPGGWFAASDWLISHDGTPSPEMAHYIKCEDLDFQMASPARYERALQAAGFTDIRLVDRHPWYKEVAREELERLSGAQRADFEAVVGRDEIEAQIKTWKAMVPVLETGEHCPHHLRGRKPG